ncbi:MAG: HAMP domain-containing sensor histidine kinase, partial [Ktedonobacterales bacterium]
DSMIISTEGDRSMFFVLGAVVSVAAGAGVWRIGARRGSEERRWRFGGLYWRMTISYFLMTVLAASIAVYAGRYEGPFGVFRGSTIAVFFARHFDGSANSGALVVFLAAVIGMLTGAVISGGLTQRLRRIARAADAWSRGEFGVVARDGSRDEVGQLARDLNLLAEQLQMFLSTRQALAVVEERNRLARELHDSVKQHVFANAMLVRAARKLSVRDPEKATVYLEEAEQLAGQTQQELVELIRALRPAAIADKGLAVVLREYADSWARRMGIAVEVRIQGERETPLDVEEAIFRVAEEALSNVARHSGARMVELRLVWEAERLRLIVRDDGMGFDAARAEGKGLGLTSMRERMEALNGALHIVSAADGTRVEACVPLAAAPLALLEAGTETARESGDE